MAGNEIDGDLGISRRQLIKRGAIVGGTVLWAAPVVQSVTMPALGQAGLYAPNCPGCQASAIGLSALGQAVGTATGTGCRCLASVNLQANLVGGAKAQVACGKADSATCTASSYLAGVEIRIDAKAVLTVGVLASCVEAGRGNASIADLKLKVTDLLGNITVTALAAAGCNSGVIVVPGFPLVQVYFNEQSCADGFLTVNALRVSVLGITVIAGQSRAGNSGCGCVACATDNLCTPPTGALC